MEWRSARRMPQPAPAARLALATALRSPSAACMSRPAQHRLHPGRRPRVEGRRLSRRHVRTPNLDRLAADGAVLNAFYAQPFSSQTRAALLTGRYPMRYGLQTLSISPSSPYGLPSEERTLAQALKEAAIAPPSSASGCSVMPGRSFGPASADSTPSTARCRARSSRCCARRPRPTGAATSGR